MAIETLYAQTADNAGYGTLTLVVSGLRGAGVARQAGLAPGEAEAADANIWSGCPSPA